MRQLKRGFTLLELMIATGILMLMISIATPTYLKSSLRARENKMRADLALIREAMDRACADTGVYPLPSDLTSATAPASGWVPGAMGASWPMQAISAASWRGPYLEKLPTNDTPFTANPEGGMLINGWVWNSTRPGCTASGYAIGAPSQNISTSGTAYNTW